MSSQGLIGIRENAHGPPCVHVLVAHALANVDEEDLDVRGVPAKAAGEEGHAEARQAAGDILVAPGTCTISAPATWMMRWQ
jgi:hypothetical protein